VDEKPAQNRIETILARYKREYPDAPGHDALLRLRESVSLVPQHMIHDLTSEMHRLGVDAVGRVLMVAIFEILFVRCRWCCGITFTAALLAQLGKYPDADAAVADAEATQQRLDGVGMMH
jgi:hypothetical protein